MDGGVGELYAFECVGDEVDDDAVAIFHEPRSVRSGELGAFLRSRRARAGESTTTTRRRSPGLRREELAAQAGITHSWLVKLEQGRANSVSPSVLAALARSLRLDDAERTHMFALAGYRLGAVMRNARLTPALRTLLEQLEPNPAYILDRCWNIVAWNRAEEKLFPPITRFTAQSPNLLALVFLDAHLEQLMIDIDEERRRLVAQFRAHVVDWPDDPEIAIIVDQLQHSSPTFRALWHAHDVLPFVTTRRVFDHDGVTRVLDHHRMAILDQPGVQLVVYTSTG